MPGLHAGLDVADLTTAICVVTEDGSVVSELTADTTPEGIAKALRPYRRRLKTVGLESGGKASWLYRNLVVKNYPMVSLDPYRAHTALKARLNKTDANDAHGLALLLARGIYTRAHVRSEQAMRIRAILRCGKL